MAIVGALLTSGSDPVDATSFTTASVTPTANALIEVDVMNAATLTGDLGTPTLSGNGLTYVQIATMPWRSNASPTRRVTRFRAMGSAPSAGAITIDFAGLTQIDCLWSVKEYTGIDTTGINGSGAIVQSATNFDDAITTTSITVTLASFGDATNNVASIVEAHSNVGPNTPEGGYTELSDSDEGSRSMATAYLIGQDTTPSYSWATGSSVGAIATEIKAGSLGELLSDQRSRLVMA